jgi:hypothetical protein
MRPEKPCHAELKSSTKTAVLYFPSNHQFCNLAFFPMNSFIEVLEPRIAPAVLVNPTTVTYTDTDGDLVTVQVSKGDLTGRLHFDSAFDSTGTQQLELISLKSKQFQDTDLTVTVVAGSGGDGFANIGFVNAKGVDLGNVNIHGDLAKILAGDKKTSTAGLGDFTVQSLAAIGPSTGAPDPYSTIKGGVGNVNISGDLHGQFFVSGRSHGTVASVTVGGSLVGEDFNFSGNINCQGDMGAVHILGGLSGSGGYASGEIFVHGKLASLQVDGGFQGGSGNFSGRVFAGGDAGAVTVNGNITGGLGSNSGTIDLEGRAESITLTGSLLGGSNNESGHVFVRNSSGDIHVTGNMIGGEGEFSGAIHGGSTINSVTVDGNVKGGSGFQSGRVLAEETISHVKIGGSLTGGTGTLSGSVRSQKDLPDVTIQGSVSSSDGLGGGSILSNENIGSIVLQSGVTGTQSSPVFITALGIKHVPHGTTTNVSINSINLTGNAEFLSVLAGYTTNLAAKNASAQINSVDVSGTAEGLSVVAGAKAGKDHLFGTQDDKKIGRSSILSQISSVVISGNTITSPDTADHYGIVAAEVTSVSVNGSALSLTSGPHNDQNVSVGAAADITVEEI